MPEFSNAEEAAQALANAVATDAGEQVAPESHAEAPGITKQPEAPDAAGETTPESPVVPELFEGVDLSDIPESVRPQVEQRLKDMRGDYTRKTQDLAEQQREAAQAIQFVQELESNPEFAYAVQQELQTALEAAGWSPQEAAAEAATQVAEATGTAEELDPSDPIVQELQELKDWRAEQEARQLQVEMENDFDRMDVAVRQANPDFVEEDWQHVYALSYATGGDLERAATAYRSEIDRIVSSYVERKSSVGAPAIPGATGPAQQPPEGFTDVYDSRATAAAQRMLEEAFGQ